MDRGPGHGPADRPHRLPRRVPQAGARPDRAVGRRSWCCTSSGTPTTASPRSPPPAPTSGPKAPKAEARRERGRPLMLGTVSLLGQVSRKIDTPDGRLVDPDPAPGPAGRGDPADGRRRHAAPEAPVLLARLGHDPHRRRRDRRGGPALVPGARRRSHERGGRRPAHRRAVPVPHRRDLRLGDPRRPADRRLPAARGPARPRGLRPAPAVGLGRRRHGVGERPRRDVPRPRDPVARRVRARRPPPAAAALG